MAPTSGRRVVYLALSLSLSWIIYMDDRSGDQRDLSDLEIAGKGEQATGQIEGVLTTKLQVCKFCKFINCDF